MVYYVAGALSLRFCPSKKDDFDFESLQASFKRTSQQESSQLVGNLNRIIIQMLLR